MSKSRVVIVGYYGANFGDLLMLRVLARHFFTIDKSVTVFTYGDPSDLRAQVAVWCDSPIDRIYAARSPCSMRDFISEVIKSDFVLWGGGTCFMDQGGTGGIKYIALASLLRRPTYYFGVGVDSHQKRKTRISLILAGCFSKKIYARDLTSLRIFKSYVPFFSDGDKVKFVPDPAFGLEIDPIPDKELRRNIVVCPRGLNGYRLSETDVERSIVGILNDLSKSLNTKNVLILIGDKEEDHDVCARLKTRLDECGYQVELLPGDELVEALKSIASACFVLTVRLHPAVVAHMHGVPYAIYKYSDKNEKFVEAVGQLGRLVDMNSHNNYEVCLERPLSSEMETSNMAECVKDALAELRGD